MNLWKPVDWLAYGVAVRWTPHLQMRTGVLVTIAGLVLIPIGFTVGEPLLVYQMSAVALILGGINVVETAVLAVNQDDNTETEDLKP